MKKCKTCYLINAKPCYECSACASGDDHYKYWPNTQTNADRIRSMSDEELTGSDSLRRRNIVRLIDKDALLSDIERTIGESGCVNHEGEIMDCIRYATEVDAVPVVRGEWIYDRYGGMWPAGLPRPEYKCSACQDWSMKQERNYCPNCGAKMEDKPCG